MKTVFYPFSQIKRKQFKGLLASMQVFNNLDKETLHMISIKKIKDDDDFENIKDKCYRR